MARLQTLRDGLAGERYYREPLTGMCFRAMAGGLCWPWEEKPGCVVVIGETRGRQNVVGMERHDVHILEERHCQDPGELLEWLERMTEDWLIRAWATPMTDRRVFMLDDANIERRRQRRPLLRYGEPRGWSGKGEGLLPFYHALAQRRTLSEKALFFGRKSMCALELAALEQRDKNILAFPSIAALCFALAEIDVDRGAFGRRLDADRLGPADEAGGY